MKYCKFCKDDCIGEEITKTEAKEIISRYCKEEISSFDEVLENRGTIDCQYCKIEIISD